MCLLADTKSHLAKSSRDDWLHGRLLLGITWIDSRESRIPLAYFKKSIKRFQFDLFQNCILMGRPVICHLQFWDLVSFIRFLPQLLLLQISISCKSWSLTHQSLVTASSTKSRFLEVLSKSPFVATGFGTLYLASPVSSTRCSCWGSVTWSSSGMFTF